MSDKESNSFFRMLESTSALGLGGLASFIFSLKQVNPEVRFEWNVGSIVVFVVGTAIGWLITRSVFRAAKSDVAGSTRRWRMVGLIALLGTGTVISFLYALRDVSPQKQWDIAVGAGTAFAFVGAALFGFYRLIRFLERHGEPEEEEMREKERNRDP